MAIRIMEIPTTHPVLQNKRIGFYFYRRNFPERNTLGVVTPPLLEEIIRLYAGGRLHTGYVTEKLRPKILQRQIEQTNTKIANEMLSIFSLYCPDDAEFNWLDSNDARLCFFCWRLVFLSNEHNATNNPADINSHIQNKMAMMLITVVIMILLAVVGIKSIEMNSRVQELSETEAELNDEIKQEQARSDELDQYEKYTQTKKYVEDVAKDKLGLVHDGEILFKESDK